MDETRTYTGFLGEARITSGPLEIVLPPLKTRFDAGENRLVLIFDDESGQQVDFDLRGTLAEVIARATPSPSPSPSPARVGPGRPKLGVVSREVSLLPTHWEWLERQPNGASAALRRLVDQAGKRDPGPQRARRAMESTGRFLSAMAGNLANYEEASRALYRANRGQFEELIGEWPQDIRQHAHRMARDAFE
ncbi:MAG TPA: DUF2239 family protein [Candidatus Solibacter sp.]|nr:DUF2239 family protein [Candidatus Solibacter sp.]